MTKQKIYGIIQPNKINVGQNTHHRKEAWPIQAPQVFHNKPEKTKNFVSYPSELFAAINQICNGNEAKVLLTLLGCKGDGSFAPSSAYVQRMSGITQPSNYYKTRAQLEKKGLIQVSSDGSIHIDAKRIVAKAKAQAPAQEPKASETK